MKKMIDEHQFEHGHQRSIHSLDDLSSIMLIRFSHTFEGK